MANPTTPDFTRDLSEVSLELVCIMSPFGLFSSAIVGTELGRDALLQCYKPSTVLIEVKGHLHEFATIGCKRFEDNEVKPLPAWIVDEHEEDFIYHTFASDPLVKGSEGENMVRILLGLLPKNRETWRKADDWHWIGSSNMVYSNFDLAEMHRSRSTRYAGGIFWHTNMTKPIGKWTGYYLSKAPLLCKYTVP
ncbi:hypothetical protein QR680_011796 [Steinernema hermaphroditum]|uniref:Uncharacterized protein n=1 Tax=Steinernema hermaphroditum TaxID=289476 RepID=A0AA39I1A3_9BILA|nr:hypothetical protein QR680_011796 [Steinernema hermaphroditum]